MSSIPSLLKLKDYITLVGTVLGVIAVALACLGERYFVSFGFFLLSITLGTDLLDGYVARKTGTANEIGKEIDSLSDSLTFGIAPSILIFQAFRTGSAYDFMLLVGVVCFAVAAILRLARFNLKETPGYTGVPTPVSCLLMINWFYFNYFSAYALGGPGNEGLEYPFVSICYFATPFIMILISWLNITSFVSFGKKGKWLYVLFIVMAPLAPFFAVIGILEPGYLISMICSVFFIIAFLLLMGLIFSGFYLRAKAKKNISANNK